MRILILSSPFCGAELIAKAIGHELDHDLIIDPVTPRPTKYYVPNDNGIGSGDNGEWVDWPTEIKQVNGVDMSPFNPKIIPNDTVGKHNVLWHNKLPGNVSEKTYCDAQRILYDRTICIGTEEIEFVAKRYMAYKNFEPEASDNYYWENFRLRHDPPYDDTMWNGPDKMKIKNSVDWLKQYAQDNSLLYILGEDIFNMANMDAFNSIIRSMGIGLKEHNKTPNHESEFFNRTRYTNIGPKY
tara:strand:- start:105 stop:827 length:723 start_codon:yes stop_codon:yes gene_type:complete